jgi:hypothetical protein
MLEKRGKLRRGLIMFGSATISIRELAQGLWHSESGRRWLAPLAVLLCVIGLVLTLAAGVEALAPFIYAIF